MEQEKFKLQFITQRTTAEDILAEVRAYLSGGGKWVQLRMKGADAKDILSVGAEVLALCRANDAVMILNDNPELAAQIGCDGVHLGKNDTHPVQARAYIGDRAIIGSTANTIDDIRELENQPVDYIGLGPFRFTTTKQNLSPTLGLEGYREIFEKPIALPVVVIGGIDIDDIEQLRAAGATNFAISGAISQATDPTEKTKKIIYEITKNR